MPLDPRLSPDENIKRLCFDADGHLFKDFDRIFDDVFGRIGRSVEDEVQQKIKRLKLPRDRSVKTVLVYDGALDAGIEEDGFFDYVVPADRLLGR